MDPIALLKKEALTIRRNIGLFLVVLVIVPIGLAAGTSVYQQTIPQDIPVGVAPAGEATTEDDLRLVRGGVQFFATPVKYEDRDALVRGLNREEIYVGFVVPPNLTVEGADATITVLTDDTNAPLADPADLALGILETEFDRGMPASVTFEHDRLGSERSLSGFLLPSALYALVVLYALIYIPYQVREERRVMDRLRTETRLEYVLASKLLFYGVLVVVPAATISIASSYYGHGFVAHAPETLLVLFLTFVLLASVGLAILFVMRLRQAAVFVNLGLAVGVLSLSGLIYPVGFYSEIRLTIARALPPHYALITIRSTMLRDTPLALYGDYIGWIAGATVLALLALAGGIRYYERGGVSD